VSDSFADSCANAFAHSTANSFAYSIAVTSFAADTDIFINDGLLLRKRSTWIARNDRVAASLITGDGCDVVDNAWRHVGGQRHCC
jgi:hypothetical protein